jgi:hypothetical protein
MGGGGGTSLEVHRGGRDEAVSAKLKGSIMATIGYLLSPLSWWNDPFINIPLAYVIGLACGLISPRLFAPAMIAGYWLTNIVGLTLLHRGAALLRPPAAGESRRWALVKYVFVMAAYSGIIFLLMWYGVLRLPKKGFTP